MPGLAANASLPIFVNAAGTALEAVTVANARIALGLVIGTNVQAFDATLLSIAALGTAADKIAYTTGVDAWAETGLTAFVRTLLDDANAGAFLATLDATLASIAALGTAADRIAYTTGVDTWAETPLTAAARSVLDDATTAAMLATLGGISNTTALAIIVKRKTADESVVSSTTLQDDDHLTFPVAANEEWIVTFYLDAANNLNTTGITLSTTFPAGGTGSTRAIATGQANPLSAKFGNNSADPLNYATADTIGQTHAAITIHCWILNGATPGNYTLQFAQSTSSATAVTLRKGSYMLATRVA